MESIRKRRKVCHIDHSHSYLTNRAERKKPKSSILCPVCTLTIRGKKAFERHYEEELKMTALDQIGPNVRSKSNIRRKSSSVEDEENSSEMKLEEREEALKNIKRRKYCRYSNMYIMSLSKEKCYEKNNSTNKINRDATRNLNNFDESRDELISCVVCNSFLNPSNDSTLKHLSRCLSRKEHEFSIYVSSEDEEDEIVEEFSWAGQTWIRTAPLLDSEFLRREGKLMRLEMEDGDEELDVDGDSHEDSYGLTQFSEADVVSSLKVDNEQKIFSAEVEDEKSYINSLDQVSVHEETLSFEQLEKNANGVSEKLIELLKAEIRKMGRHLDNSLKCSICVGPYNNPLVSTSCWHVCCTDCWLRSLGTKKLCPICGSIVSPAQLRKIFL